MIENFNNNNLMLQTNAGTLVVFLKKIVRAFFAFAKNRCPSSGPPPPCLNPVGLDDQFTLQVLMCSEKLFNFFSKTFEANLILMVKVKAISSEFI